MKTRELITGIVILIGVIAVIVYVAYAMGNRDSESTITSGPRIGIVDVEGVIVDSRPVVKWLEKLRKNKDVKAIVVRVNSPGGGVAPSQELYEALKRVKKAGKPVIVSMASVAASGGYYLAVAADTIVANPGSITGSIGVIMSYPELRKLADKIGVSMQTIKAGKWKDVPNQFRDLSPEERAYLQSMIDDSYDQFIHAVADGRQLPLDSVKALAQGRVYTGRQAFQVGLVDVLGTYEDAIRLAARTANIPGEPKLLKPKGKRTGWFYLIFGEDEEASASTGIAERLLGAATGAESPVMEYRWTLP